jgi:hypothetical protein
VVQFLQSLHDQITNVGTQDLPFASLVKLSLDGVYKFINGACRKGAFLTGFANTQKEFIAAEFLTPSILLNNEDIMWLYALVGSEPSIAGEALPSAPHSFVYTPGIYHLRLLLAAGRTVHKFPLKIVV